MTKNNRIAILTGGGDAPGINAVIRAVAKKAILAMTVSCAASAGSWNTMTSPAY